jgi:uncharacterized protein YlxP (DUF503 family)
VGLLEMELVIRDAVSLKDKRRIVKSLKDRISSRFNVSVAEVDHLDSRQQALLGVTMVANETKFVQSALSKIVDFVRAAPAAGLLNYHMEVW